MKRMLRACFALVIALACCMSLALGASAVELPSGTIPVSVGLKGGYPSNEVYTIVLQADDASYPMPKGSVDGAFLMTIKGKGTTSVPAIEYEKVGIYTYKLYQVAGTNKACTYDATVYSLTVSITNNADYTGFDVNVALHAGDSEEKPDVVTFLNKYKVYPADTPITGDESHPMFHAVLVGAGMAVILGLFLTRKKKTTEE